MNQGKKIIETMARKANTLCAFFIAPMLGRLRKVVEMSLTPHPQCRGLLFLERIKHEMSIENLCTSRE